MRLYYYYPSPSAGSRHSSRKRVQDRIGGAHRSARRIHQMSSTLFRSDSAASIGKLRSARWRVRGKVKDPTWVAARRYLPGASRTRRLCRTCRSRRRPGQSSGPLPLDLSIPEYGLHGTNVPWGVGMTVSHGCVRLYPEDIERLFSKTAGRHARRIRLSAGQIRLARRRALRRGVTTTCTANIRGCGSHAQERSSGGSHRRSSRYG